MNFFTSLWGGFNWLARQETNHRVSGFKKDSWIITVFSDEYEFLASLIAH